MYSVSFVGTNYKIGIDGGGTKTELILVDGTGTVVARHLAPGCNPSQVGPEKALVIVREALAALLAGAKTGPGEARITHTLFCSAGNRDFWRESAAKLTGCGKVTTADDSLPVLELATDGQPGLVLHAGTGSFVAARAPDQSVHYVGGLGWKLGDPGSGFDLGRRGIAAAMLELQARPASLSPLAAALCAHTGLADYSANSRFFYNDAAANARITAFAQPVIELAAKDCGPARQALEDSLTELARLADGVMHRLFPRSPSPLPCGASGRILNSAPAIPVLSALAARFGWPVELRFIETAPIEGVRRLLLKAG